MNFGNYIDTRPDTKDAEAGFCSIFCDAVRRIGVTETGFPRDHNDPARLDYEEIKTALHHVEASAYTVAVMENVYLEYRAAAHWFTEAARFRADAERENTFGVPNGYGDNVWYAIRQADCAAKTCKEQAADARNEAEQAKERAEVWDMMGDSTERTGALKKANSLIEDARRHSAHAVAFDTAIARQVAEDKANFRRAEVAEGEAVKAINAVIRDRTPIESFGMNVTLDRKSPASKFRVGPLSEVAEAVKIAILKLDPEVDQHWVMTGAHKGKPKLQAVEDAYGKAGLTRSDIEAAVPGYTRDAALDAALANA